MRQVTDKMHTCKGCRNKQTINFKHNQISRQIKCTFCGLAQIVLAKIKK